MREPAAERLVGGIMRLVFGAAFLLLAAGVLAWAIEPGTRAAGVLLSAGLLSLFGMPILKLVAIVLAAMRERDVVTLAATLIVIAILLALTMRDAARL